MAAVAISDIKNAIKSDVLATITGRDDSVITRQIAAAETWVTGECARGGVTPDLTAEHFRQVVINETLSLLWSYNEQEDVAKDKHIRSVELLKAAIGIEVANGTGKSVSRPHVSTAEGEVPSWLSLY